MSNSAPQWPSLDNECWQDMFQTIEDSMNNHYMCDIRGDDGESYSLVDMLTPDGFSVYFGRNEIHMIVDNMYHDIKEYLSKISENKDNAK